MDKRSLRTLIFAGCLLALLPRPSEAATLTLDSTQVEVCFSPKGGCTDAIVRRIDQAKSEILVQAYSFTSLPIARALTAAHKRGIKVLAILDKSQRRERYTSADFLARAGIATYIDDKHAIAHNKIMIIDGETVITGSFNFTKAAEDKNAENLLIIRNESLARAYMNEQLKHIGHSEYYREKGMDRNAKSHIRHGHSLLKRNRPNPGRPA